MSCKMGEACLVFDGVVCNELLFKCLFYFNPNISCRFGRYLRKIPYKFTTDYTSHCMLGKDKT